MIVLALDGARQHFSVAIAADGEALAAGELGSKQALEGGLGLAAELLQQTRLSPKSLDRIAVGIGPGSFTGVRIAISYAKALAQAWRLPLAGVDTFDALEAGLALQEPRLTVVRGRTGVISVRYRAGGREQRASGYVADVLEQLGPGRGALQVAGDAQDVLAGLAERGWDVNPLSSPLPAALAVAAIAARREPAPSIHEVRADYGELPAAKVPVLRKARE